MAEADSSMATKTVSDQVPAMAARMEVARKGRCRDQEVQLATRMVSDQGLAKLGRFPATKEDAVQVLAKVGKWVWLLREDQATKAVSVLVQAKAGWHPATRLACILGQAMAAKAVTAVAATAEGDRVGHPATKAVLDQGQARAA